MSSYLGNLFYIIFVLLIMAGALYGVLYLVKKYLYSFDQNTSTFLNMKVVANFGIAPKKSVTVVRIKDKLYILGVTDQSVSLIDKIDDIAEPEDPGENPSRTNTFLEILKKNMGMK